MSNILSTRPTSMINSKGTAIPASTSSLQHHRHNPTQKVKAGLSRVRRKNLVNVHGGSSRNSSHKSTLQNTAKSLLKNVLGVKLRSTELVQYVPLNQTDPEIGGNQLSNPKYQHIAINSHSHSAANSSSEVEEEEEEEDVEDLFVARSQQRSSKISRKMTRKGSYSMNADYDSNGHKYYTATKTHQHSHYNHHQQQQQQQQQHQSMMPNEWNLQNQPKHQEQQQQQQHFEHFYQYETSLPPPLITPEYEQQEKQLHHHQQQQQQQHHYQELPQLQYENVGISWLPSDHQNNLIPHTANATTTISATTTNTTTNTNTIHDIHIEDYRQTQGSAKTKLNNAVSHCSRRVDAGGGDESDATAAGPTNICNGLKEKTFLTPFDIPPPPLPPTATATANINEKKTFPKHCQCEHSTRTQTSTPYKTNHQHQQYYHALQQKATAAGLRGAATTPCHHRETSLIPPPPQYKRINNINFISSHYLSAAPEDDDNDTSPSVKNLVYSPQKIRRIRLIVSVVGGLILLAVLATALVLIIRKSEEEAQALTLQNGIHLEDILHGKLTAKHFNGSWSNGSNILFKDNNDIIWEMNVKTKEKTKLFHDELHQYPFFEKSADGQLLLLTKNYKKNFRYSHWADYDIYNISSGQIKPVLIQNQEKPLIMVHWSPVGNGLVINYERNLYYKPTAFADEISITKDTNPAILNGIPDWVYEEEVFASDTATWFSPDGRMLAFIQFDDTPTSVINFPIYGEAGDLRFQYPYQRLVAYPKSGSSNPRVKLFTVDLERVAVGDDNYITEIPVPSALNTESDYIISIVEWLNNTNVLSVWMNRIQNTAHMQIFNGLRRQEIYSLHSKTGWVDFFSSPHKNHKGSRIALVLPQLQDDNVGEYRHLCLLSTTTTSSQPEPITKGKYVVTSILHWNTANDVIFYTANTEQHPEQSHVYAIKAYKGQTPKCVTCKLQRRGNVDQSYYTAVFNTEHEVVITSQGPGIPFVAVYEWSYANNQLSVTKLMDWETNKALVHKLENYDLPTTEIHTIPIASGFTAKVLLQLPPKMDRSGNTKYPLLVDVYGGPDSYSVVNKWNIDWGTYLTSNQSVIYAKIDGRGSGLRGEKLLHSVYLKLGTVEITDQIQVTKQLQEKFAFIDNQHSGIWGWSYGGYAAAMALANDNHQVFKCAASIAPVTDWAYYDSIYTERYMSLPILNELGYRNSRLSTKALQLKGKKYLLVHGTLDDNVHYQQAMILAKNLERHDILFKQISYPDEDHALAGVRPHLYHSMDRFFGECFGHNIMATSK